jgi:hypothetical protein
MMTVSANVEITGPGLVVNHPVAVIYKALTDAGYKVNIQEFAGQHQYCPAEEWPAWELDKHTIDGQEIILNVNPLPWGG